MSAAALEVKSLTANGVAFKVTGKSTHESHTSGTVRPSASVVSILPEANSIDCISWKPSIQTNHPVDISRDYPFRLQVSTNPTTFFFKFNLAKHKY